MNESNPTTLSFQVGALRRGWNDVHSWSTPSVSESAVLVATATPDKIIYTVKRVLLSMHWTGNRDVDAPRVRANVHAALLAGSEPDALE